MDEKIVKLICDELGPLLPATIALVDLADTKRRNLYLGFERVDQDIAELEQLIHSTVAGAACRVAGDQWLLVPDEAASLQDLADRFALAEPIRLRFRSWAQDSGSEAVEAVEISYGQIERRIRCLSALCPPGSRSLLDGLMELQKYIAYAPVGRALSLEVQLAGGLPEITSRWRCLDDTDPAPVCLLCQSQTFTWTGGAYDCSEGICSACGARVDFRWGVDA
ncbi:MAG: hypothetical protein ACAI44_32400 [Candidatus Sericytochromatia bacterium]